MKIKTPTRIFKKFSIGKIANIILFIFFTIFILTLFTRSLIYTQRVFNETKNFFSTPANSLSKTFYPSITPCSSKTNIKIADQLQLWNYRNLGEKCQE